MGFHSTSEFKSGLKIMIDNDPCVIVSNEFVKPGKGQAFNRVKYRNYITGRVIERTYKSGESLEAADVVETEMQYLYHDSGQWVFMNMETYDQIMVDDKVIANVGIWLKEQDVCTLTLWNDNPIGVSPAVFVNLKVVEGAPGVKGDTVSGGTKQVVLETGASLKVPLFINLGDVLKIDTRIGEYVSRVKE